MHRTGSHRLSRATVPPVLGAQGTMGGSEQKGAVTGAQGQVCGHGQAGGRAGFPPEQPAEQSRMFRNGADGEEQVLWPGRRKQESGQFRFEMLLTQIPNKRDCDRNANSVTIRVWLVQGEG